jgi:tetratricopeptide (TPR) repeat protein
MSEHDEVTRSGASPEPAPRPSREIRRKVALVGRGPELRELDDALGRALATGEPHTVTLLGAAGVGKTRLVDEFLERVKDREKSVRVFRGAAREGGPTFGVIEKILRNRFDLGDETHGETFRKMVSDAFGDRRVGEFLHFLGAFLGLRFPDSPFIKAFEEEPEQFSRISGAVLRRFFEVDAERAGATVIAFEDLHWAADDSLRLVRYLVDAMRGAPILLLVSARPELLARQADWLSAGGNRHTRLELSPLAPDDAAALMYHLLEPCGDPPEELVDSAVDMAGGSPYLLEQMVRAFHRSGALSTREDGSWAVDLSKLEDSSLPFSVDDAISARISSLAAFERSILEMASTMGGVFWLGALVALSRVKTPTPDLWGGHASAEAHIRDALASLADRDYVLELPDSSIPREHEYAFKHNLERETVHRLTNRTVARRYHLIVAEWLEYRLAERAEEQCELLAHHFEEGGLPSKAAAYYLLAGDKARARYANSKAAEYYSRGLDLLGDQDRNRKIDALHHYGDVLQLAGKNDEALQAFRDMLDIAFKLDLKAKGGAAHNRIGRLHRAVGRLDEAMRHLGTGLALFEAAGDPRGIASSLDDVGKVHWMRGNYEAAERFMRQALERRQELGDQRSIALSFNNLGLVYQDSGRFAEAHQHFQEALVVRRAIDDQPGIAQTLNNLGTIAQDNGDDKRALEFYREALEVAREVGDRMRQAVILTNIGESNYRLQKPEAAIDTLEQAEEVSSTLGDRILEGEIMRGLAKAHLLQKDTSRAKEYIARSISLFEEARGRPFLGVALRSQAEIYAAAGWGEGEDYRLAKDSFEKALRLFTELGNDLEIARTCRSYAALLESHPDATPTSPLLQEAQILRARANQIQERLKATEDSGLPPLEGEATQPGLPTP